MVTCHLREMVTWIHRKRITDLTAFHLWMVRYFDPLIPNICLCLLLLLWSSLFLATPSPQILWSLSRDVFEQHTSTGSRAFSHLICLDAYNKFVWLSIFTLIETICKKFMGTWTAKSSLLVDMRCLSSLICWKGVVSYTQATVPQLHNLACRFFCLFCASSALFLPSLLFFPLLYSLLFFPLTFLSLRHHHV